MVHGKRGKHHEVVQWFFSGLVCEHLLTMCTHSFTFSKSNSGHAPEAEFLEKIKAIPGVSMVETQTITNMEI